MLVTAKQKRWLKQQAHALKPVVLIGQFGITEPVLTEIQGALDHHELIKVRVNAGDRDERQAGIDLICTRTEAELIGRIGNIAILYRANPRKREPIRLPLG